MAMFESVDASARERIAAMKVALGNVDAHPESPSTAPDLLAKARSFSTAGDWKSVSALDDELARVLWTAVEKIEAVQMRADWRSRVTSDSHRKRSGEECLALIDEAIVVQPTRALHGLRAKCAVAAGRSDVVIESLSSLGNTTYSWARDGEESQRRAAQRDLELLVTALTRNVPATPGGTFDRTRRDEVVEKLRANINKLQ
jgi:hypothetical protein